MFLSNLHRIFFIFLVFNCYYCMASSTEQPQSQTSIDSLEKYFDNLIKRNDDYFSRCEEYAKNNFIIQDFAVNILFNNPKEWSKFVIGSHSSYYMICLEGTDELKAENVTAAVLKYLEYAYGCIKIIERRKDFFLNTIYNLKEVKHFSALKLFSEGINIHKMFDIFFIKSNSKENLLEKTNIWLKKLSENTGLEGWRFVFMSNQILEGNEVLSLDQNIKSFVSKNNPRLDQLFLFVTNKNITFNNENPIQSSSILPSFLQAFYKFDENKDKQKHKIEIQFKIEDRSSFNYFKKKKLEKYLIYRLEIKDTVSYKSIEFFLLFENKEIKYITSPNCNWIHVNDIFYYTTNDFMMKTFKDNLESLINHSLKDSFESCVNILKFCESKIMFAKRESVFMEEYSLPVYNKDEVRDKFKNFFTNLKEYFEKERIEIRINFMRFCENKKESPENILRNVFYNLNNSSYDTFGCFNYEYSKHFDYNFAKVINEIGQNIVENLNEDDFYNSFSVKSKCGALLRFLQKDGSAFNLQLIFILNDNILSMMVFSESNDLYGNADLIIGIFNKSWFAA